MKLILSLAVTVAVVTLWAFAFAADTGRTPWANERFGVTEAHALVYTTPQSDDERDPEFAAQLLRMTEEAGLSVAHTASWASGIVTVYDRHGSFGSDHEFRSLSELDVQGFMMTECVPGIELAVRGVLGTRADELGTFSSDLQFFGHPLAAVTSPALTPPASGIFATTGVSDSELDALANLLERNGLQVLRIDTYGGLAGGVLPTNIGTIILGLSAALTQAIPALGSWFYANKIRASVAPALLAGAPIRALFGRFLDRMYPPLLTGLAVGAGSAVALGALGRSVAGFGMSAPTALDGLAVLTAGILSSLAMTIVAAIFTLRTWYAIPR